MFFSLIYIIKSTNLNDYIMERFSIQVLNPIVINSPQSNTTQSIYYFSNCLLNNLISSNPILFISNNLSPVIILSSYFSFCFSSNSNGNFFFQVDSILFQKNIGFNCSNSYSSSKGQFLYGYIEPNKYLDIIENSFSISDSYSQVYSLYRGIQFFFSNNISQTNIKYDNAFYSTGTLFNMSFCLIVNIKFEIDCFTISSISYLSHCNFLNFNKTSSSNPNFYI